MTRIHAITCALTVGLLALAGATTAQDSDEAAGSAAVVLGTFDSRAIALAYYRSDEFNASLAELREELEATEAAGDAERARELEAHGPALQARMHRRTFGTASVLDLLEPVEDEVAGIAKRAGVDVIVSRWDLAYRRPAAELVDVTEELAGLFDPDEETLRSMAELLRTDPVPLADLADRDH